MTTGRTRNIDDLEHTPGQRFRATTRTLLGVDRRTAAAYLRDQSHPRLQVGAGKNVLPGWLNTNYWFPLHPGSIFLDAARPFPLPDEAFDRVYTEHMIEHIAYRVGVRMLTECFRVLKPGGRIRVSTPDLAFLSELQTDSPTGLQQQYIAWCIERLPDGEYPPTLAGVINRFVRAWGHAFIFDEPTLGGLLSEVGFADIVRCPIGSSLDEHFDGLDHESRMPTGFLALETMALEAHKPA
jgi:predicted SAM-dependent methyltransferase